MFIDGVIFGLYGFEASEIDYAVKILVVFLISIVNYFGRDDFIAQRLTDI